MNYIQALGDAFAGKVASAFSGELQAELHRDREEMGRDGFTLVIEPLEDVKEKITSVNQGGKMIEYKGSFRYAFRTRDGRYVEAPVESAREVSHEETTERGMFVFFVDENGTVVSWTDTLTGNTHGKGMPRIRGEGAIEFKMALVWIAVAILLMAGGFYIASRF